MTARLPLVALALCLALPLAAAPAGAERLRGDFRDAIAATYPETPGLALYDALGRLQAKPDSAVDLQAVRQAVGQLEDPTLTPFFDALVTLNAAAEGDGALFRRGLARVRAGTESAALLNALDFSGAQTRCPDCRGELRCATCRGTLRCADCKGNGFTIRRATATQSLGGGDRRTLGGSLRAGKGAGSLRVPCARCDGSGKCPACKGTPIVCTACGTTGKVPDPAQAESRVGALAGQMREAVAAGQAEAIEAREQTRLLADDLRKASAIGDPAEALAFLNALPAERAKAAQGSQLGTIRLDLESIVQARAANDSAKIRARETLRAAIRSAQGKSDPVKGLAALAVAIQAQPDCDALPEAQTAFDGLLATARRQSAQRHEDLSKRLELIASLTAPQDRLAQAERLLADWPKPTREPKLLAYAKANRLTALQDLLEDDALGGLRGRVEATRDQALAELQTAEEEGSAWWVWVAAGLGALVALYALLAAVQAFFARRAEAERKARQRAAMESVRKTFSHRKR